jgi:hypothetical protein
MESTLINIVRSARLVINFPKNKKDESSWDDKTVLAFAIKHKSMSDLVKSSPDLYRNVLRMGLKDKVSELIKKRQKVG